MKIPLTTNTEQHPDVCFVEIIKHGFSFASSRAIRLFKANAYIVLAFLVCLSLIQVWQERNSPVLKTSSLIPYSVVLDSNESKVENYCFSWEFEITKAASLVNFNWRLDTANGSYFVTPWIKEHGRFAGAISPSTFEKVGLNRINLCASASLQDGTKERLRARLTYEVRIFGILPWTNNTYITTTF